MQIVTSLQTAIDRNQTTNIQPQAAIYTTVSSTEDIANLNNIVFYENDEYEEPDYSDMEEEDDEEILDSTFDAEDVVEVDVVENEVEEEADVVEDEDMPIEVRGDFFPFRDKIHQLMHQFYYRSGGDISQSLMKEILKLVSDVSKAKFDYPDAKIPAADLLFNYDNPKRTKNRIPVLKQTQHQVTKSKVINGREVEELRTFYMNPPSEILKLLVANPSTTDRLTALPDHTEGELVESYQSSKWQTHEMFQHPMVTKRIRGVDKDFWIGNLVKTRTMLAVIDRFYTMNHDTVMFEGYAVTQTQDQEGYVFVSIPEKVHVKLDEIVTVVSDQIDQTQMYFQPSVYANPSLLDQCNGLLHKLRQRPNLKRESGDPHRRYKPVKVIPLNFFTDDMSGNRTKKHNKFDSWIMVPAALPLKERHALENTAFICTDHALSAMEMLPAIVKDLLLLENGVEMMLPGGEAVIVTAPLQFITADNARHSEIASSRGAISSKPCRKCEWEVKTPARPDGGDYDAAPRSESVVSEMYRRYLSSGCDQSHLVDKEAGYKLVGGQALLALKSFDTMLDCPIELLHTIMLGVGKNLVKSLLQDHLKPQEKHQLEKGLFGYVSKGFTRKLRSSLRLHGSFLGRDYKILIQQIPVVLNQLMQAGSIRDNDQGVQLIRNCFDDLGRLVSLVYISKIKSKSNMYLTEVATAYRHLRSSVLSHDEFRKAKFPRRQTRGIYKSSKMHILHHLVDDIQRFGSAVFYETEKGEQFNKFIRECLFRTNRHNPSRDTAVAFAKRMMAKHVLTGGSWFLGGHNSPLKATEKVLRCSSTFESVIRNFANNDDDKLLVKLGSTGIFRNKYGNLLIGEVVKIDAVEGTYVVAEYGLFCNSEWISRFVPVQDNISNGSVYHTCCKGPGGNLVISKLTTRTTISETDGQFVEMLDISRSDGDFQLINTSKFGTFWWTLSHKNSY